MKLAMNVVMVTVFQHIAYLRIQQFWLEFSPYANSFEDVVV
jgi:hypothetical protein